MEQGRQGDRRQPSHASHACPRLEHDHDAGFTPEFSGIEDFAGTVIHPQHWPAELDHTGKRVVVIGSGATAITLIPSMARTAGHVTMLQRSPSYVFSMPAHDSLAHALRKLVGHERAHRMVRRKNILFTRATYKASRRMPKLMRRLLIANVRRQLPRHFDVDTHFTPRYAPWDQRLCVVPDGDLFKAISAGRASVVTDHIDRFTKTGILLKSGQELTADIAVTATGLTMSPFGGIRLSVDGRETKPSDTMAYKAMMLSGCRNSSSRSATPTSRGRSRSIWSASTSAACSTTWTPTATTPSQPSSTTRPSNGCHTWI
ncbi:NAD(P)/FAD-dependent oxidoreductase [Streptomyces bangladeshensis]|uniref:Uncharacterized protein n=1 Tax=Streptomyces bangladeshensis TaxID=295352 RepID=A0ABN3BF66_9ACTN